MTTPFNAVQKQEEKDIQKLAKERALVIDGVVKQILDLLVEKDFSVNDFQVVVNQCNTSLNAVYLGRKVKDLM